MQAVRDLSSRLGRWPLPALAACLMVGCAAPTNEPANLSLLKDKVGAYVDGGQYDADLTRVAVEAKHWIERRSTTGGKLAVVFDIDETTLSNLPHMRQEDWGYQPKIWEEWVDRGTAKAIQPVREVYQTAREHHVAVFFLSGRRESGKEATRRNLAHEGIAVYEALIVRGNSNHEPVATFKAAQRAKIAAQGYTIIANIGDQKSDFAGGYSERDFKLPNPFYFIK